MKTNSCERYAIRRAAAIGLLLCMMGALAGLAAESRPTIGVLFRIEADDFQKFQAELGQPVAETLTGLLKASYGFVNWKAGSTITPGEAVAGTLVVRLVSEKKMGVDVFDLSFSALSQAGKEFNLAALGTIPMYGSWDNPPMHNSHTLGEDLKSKLAGHFSNEPFHEKLRDNYISKIPLVENLEVSEHEKMLVVPVDNHEFKIDQGSELHVKFKTTENPGLLGSEGYIDLNTEIPRQGAFGCSVKKFFFPPDQTDGWHSRIPEVLKKERRKSVRVFMVRYKPAAQSGLFDDPFED